MMRLFRLVMLLLFTSVLHAAVYLEEPENFNPQPPTVVCCFLHNGDKILLLHRQDWKPEGNRWGIPGGKQDKGEAIMDTVAREVYEETGFQLEKEQLHYIGKLYIKVPDFDFEYHMVDYRKEIENPGDVKININEHKGFTWVTPKDALKMDLITDEDVCFEVVFGLEREKVCAVP